mgnify:CR=1 FL=1
MTKLLFIGDVVGQAGLAFLERRLPALVDEHRPNFVIVNAENLDTTFHRPSPGNCGMTSASLARLLALPVDLVTGGNHSWDGPDVAQVLASPHVIRPLNYSTLAPGRGAAIAVKDGVRLGVINLVSRTAFALADDPLAALDAQLAAWENQTDLILVDFHGESVTEKQTAAFACDGRVAAVLGTHTHVRTLDTGLLPQGTAFVTDVGMTGPTGGVQGYQPQMFVNHMRLRLPTADPLAEAAGPVELGAVLITCQGRRAVHIERILE